MVTTSLVKSRSLAQRAVQARQGDSRDKVLDRATGVSERRDHGMMRTGWTGDWENPLLGQALLSAGE
jgi:hypothetical protein